MAPRNVSTALRGAAFSAAITVVSLVVGGAIALGFGAPFASTSAALALVVLLAMARWARPHLVTTTAVSALLTLTPVLWLGAQWALSEALATSGGRCGTGDLAIPILVLVLVMVASALAVPLAWLASNAGKRAHHVLFGVSVALLAAGCILVACALSLRRPPPDAFLALFDTTTLEPGASRSLGTTSYTLDTAVSPAPLLGDEHCTVHVSRSDAKTVDVRVFAVGACPRVRVYHDPRSRLSLVGLDHTPFRAEGIVDDDGRHTSDVLLGDFRGRTGRASGMDDKCSPRPCAVCRSHRHCRRHTAHRKAPHRPCRKAAEHVGGGWIKGEGRPPRFVAELARAAPGPVLVEEAAAGHPTYREVGAVAPLTVTVGDHGVVQAATMSRANAWLWVACFALASTATPLWVAWTHGLL